MPLNVESRTSAEGSPQVRFAAVNEQIAPNDGFTGLSDDSAAQDTSNKDRADIDQLSKTLHGTHLQERRMSHFAFEPVSLPVSRVRHYQLKNLISLRVSPMCTLGFSLKYQARQKANFRQNRGSGLVVVVFMH